MSDRFVAQLDSSVTYQHQDAGSAVQQNFAFVFPGQGSQRVGMLADAALEFSQVKEAFAEASEALGEDLWALVESGPVEQLNLTENTQPVLLAASVALWRVWRDLGGIEPAGMAGHSLGEISALCCADAIQFADAVRLVRARGRFMQNAVPAGEGAMAAVLGLETEQVEAICEATGAAHPGVVAAVNYNSPHQVVIAGHAETVQHATAAMSAAGARRVMPLAVSAPFHTELMQPAGEQLATVLDEIELRTPRIPVIHNVTAAAETDAQVIRKLLVAQVSAPVRWTECIKTLQTNGALHYSECGPGKVLGGLVRRIDRSLDCYHLENPRELREAIEAVSGVPN